MDTTFPPAVPLPEPDHLPNAVVTNATPGQELRRPSPRKQTESLALALATPSTWSPAPPGQALAAIETATTVEPSHATPGTDIYLRGLAAADIATNEQRTSPGGYTCRQDLTAPPIGCFSIPHQTVTPPPEDSELDCITVSRTLTVDDPVVPQGHMSPVQEPERTSDLLSDPDANAEDSLQQSKVVILKLHPQRPANTAPPPTSSAPAEGAGMIQTPPHSHSSSGRRTAAEQPASSRKRNPRETTHFSPRLYGRTPNPRRAATKGYRGPPTPEIRQPTPERSNVPQSARPIKPLSASVVPQHNDDAAQNQIGSAQGPGPLSSAPAKLRKRSAKEAAAPKTKRQRIRKDAAKPSALARIEDAAHSKPQTITAHDGCSDTSQKPGTPQITSDDHSLHSPRPVRDADSDGRFVQDLLPLLADRAGAKRNDIGRQQAQRILQLLRKAEHPTDKEALFLTGDEASTWLLPGRFWNSIIVTTGQQAMPLQTPEQFLAEHYNDEAKVWIQDPGVIPSKKNPVCKQVKMSAIKDRLLSSTPSKKPWNLLELACHVDDGLRPAFLNTEDSRLLTKLKVPCSVDEARRRDYNVGYKEVEKWALLAEAGALTEPHQDSHGYSTFITINQGPVGFGWLSSPSADERTQWLHKPQTFEGGNWRYIILKPGQTVYFPAGTVHFVFRSPHHGNTLAFGGHVLRCSNIVHWVKTMIEEKSSQEIANEDLSAIATGYLGRVEKYVLQALRTGTEEKWGGKESIEEFLELKKTFEGMKKGKK